MLDQHELDNVRRELERAQRDYSRAKNTIEVTKRQLAEFVLLNSELIARGEAIDLTPYEEAINEAEWSMGCAQKSFAEQKDRLTIMVNRIGLHE